MKVYKANKEATLPEYATDGSAAFDLSACIKNQQYLASFNSWNKQQRIIVKGVGASKDAFQLPPGIRVLVPTGLIFDIPKNHVLKLFIRSGTALKHGLSLSNGTGIIDSDYVEETILIIQNNTDSLVTIENGQKLAQGILEKTTRQVISETNVKPGQKTDRDGGFGSTGE